MRIIILEKEKSDELYYVIAKDQEMFSDSEKSYYKMYVALERLQETVEVLNNIKLAGKWNTNATDFVVWVNYAYLLVECIDLLAKEFSIPLLKTWGIFDDIHKISDRNDWEFFRFVRAIVLPHSLSLDFGNQKFFTNNRTAFCPRVYWDTDNCITIVYYNSTPKDDFHFYNIPVKKCEEFIKNYYDQIDDLIKIVPLRKAKHRQTMKGKLIKEIYDSNMKIKDKCLFLQRITKQYGNVDDKAETSFNMLMLKRCENILNMKFYGRNKDLFEKYKVALHKALDEYFQYLCSNRNDEKMLDWILFPTISHSSSETPVFSGKEYPINKIVAECENFDSYYKRYYWDELYEELYPCLKPYIYITRRMDMMKVCYLSIMVAFFCKLEYSDKYKNAFL